MEFSKKNANNNNFCGPEYARVLIVICFIKSVYTCSTMYVLSLSFYINDKLHQRGKFSEYIPHAARTEYSTKWI